MIRIWSRAVSFVTLGTLVFFLPLGLSSSSIFAEMREPLNTSNVPSNQLPNNLQGVGIQQKLGAQIPLNLNFNDEFGHPIRLSEIIRNKPLILTLAYYKCPSLCTLVLNGVVNALKQIQPTLGEDYNALTVSINPKETPSLALAKKRSYLTRYARLKVTDQEMGWRFLTGQEESIRKLADSVGFSYSYDSQSGQYSHASVAMIVTPDGKLSQYLFGISYSPRSLELAIKKAATAEIGSPLNQFLLYCFHYDATTGKRTVKILNLLKVLAIMTLLGIAGALFQAKRMERAL